MAWRGLPALTRASPFSEAATAAVLYSAARSEPANARVRARAVTVVFIGRSFPGSGSGFDPDTPSPGERDRANPARSEPITFRARRAGREATRRPGRASPASPRARRRT